MAAWRRRRRRVGREVGSVGRGEGDWHVGGEVGSLEGWGGRVICLLVGLRPAWRRLLRRKRRLSASGEIVDVGFCARC